MNLVSRSAAIAGVVALSLALPARGQDANDKIFADRAAASNMAELAEAKLALDQSQNDNVRKFARRMIQDHGATGDALTTLAKVGGFGLPTTPTESRQKEIARLRALTGAEFDRAYLNGQVTAHRDAVDLFLRESKSGSDSGLVHFAERALPILNDHLQMARSLAQAR